MFMARPKEKIEQEIIDLENALSAFSNGVQEYSINGRMVKRQDRKQLEDRLDYLYKRLERLESGNGSVRIVRGIPW